MNEEPQEIIVDTAPGRLIIIIMSASMAQAQPQLVEEMKRQGYVPIERVVSDQDMEGIRKAIFEKRTIGYSIGYALAKHLEQVDRVTASFAEALPERQVRRLFEPPVLTLGRNRVVADYAALEMRVLQDIVRKDLEHWAYEDLRQSPPKKQPRQDALREASRQKIPSKGSPQPSPWARRNRR